MQNHRKRTQRSSVCSLLSLALLVTACVGQQKAGSFAPGATFQPQTSIPNQPVFDVASCQSRQIPLPFPPTPGILVAATYSARPQVMECLVDPKNRGPSVNTRIMVETLITDQSASHTIHGENLTPAGRRCVGEAMNSLVPLSPLARGARPVEARTEFFHELHNSPSITFGSDEGFNFSGSLRLAQGTWCHCYVPFIHQAPPVLTAKITLTSSRSTPVEVTFEPAVGAEATLLTDCLKKEISTLPVRHGSDTVTLLHRFFHLHSLASEPAAGLPPDLHYQQLELVRGQRAAAAAMAYAAHTYAQEGYNAMATQYNQSSSKSARLLASLIEKCAELLKASDAWTAAVEAQQETDQQVLMLVQQFKSTNTHWSRLEAASRLALVNTEAEVERARRIRQRDEQACRQSISSRRRHGRP